MRVREVYELEKPFCRLLHFVKEGAPRQPRVLVFAPLSGHHSTLLRDTVRTLLADHDVWITDWLDARDIPITHGPFHFDDYVKYVREFIAFVGPDCHAISVCQPTVPVLAAVSLMAAAGEKIPKTLTMMGGPIDARRSPTAVNNFAHNRPLSWFEAKVIQRVPMRYPGFMRRVYPGFLQFAGFVAMNPERHMDSHVQYYHHLVEGDGESADSHRRFYDEYNATMDLPAEYYLETVERVFQKHLLPQGKLVVAGERVRSEAIRTAASSPSRASSTTSPATARPSRAGAVQGHSRRATGSTSSPRAWATTASSAAASTARSSIRASGTSSNHTVDSSRPGHALDLHRGDPDQLTAAALGGRHLEWSIPAAHAEECSPHDQARHAAGHVRPLAEDGEPGRLPAAEPHVPGARSQGAREEDRRAGGRRALAQGQREHGRPHHQVAAVPARHDQGRREGDGRRREERHPEPAMWAWNMMAEATKQSASQAENPPTKAGKKKRSP
jgi:hypothetical protein